MPETPQFRHVNHVEMVHAPGERHLALRAFEVLGGRLSVSTAGTPVALDIAADLVGQFPNDNALYVSEVTPEQWAYETALRDALQADSHLRGAQESYLAKVRSYPQGSFHFGIRFESREALEERIDAINVAADEPDLKGRISLSGVYPPGSYTNTMLQAFVWTDIMASGLLTIGQHIELQWRMAVPALDEAPVV